MRTSPQPILQDRAADGKFWGNVKKAWPGAIFGISGAIIQQVSTKQATQNDPFATSLASPPISTDPAATGLPSAANGAPMVAPSDAAAKGMQGASSGPNPLVIGAAVVIGIIGVILIWKFTKSPTVAA